MFQNTVRFKRILLNLAEWLEVDRAPVTFLITNKSLPVIGTLINRFVRVHDLQNKFQELMVVGAVLAASSLVRERLLREAREYHRILMKSMGGAWCMCTPVNLTCMRAHTHMYRHSLSYVCACAHLCTT
eukprot:TRINITY_DN60588_c0_g1_i2.p1 TRINITY_DN60588_c0_g1~~TRINITY_DN60588_c0_g1_i2.p1  ORF type:complete len:129 (+),score=18.49 TRINITY_DN60588_c0_g1_i2:88-474(+)